MWAIIAIIILDRKDSLYDAERDLLAIAKGPFIATQLNSIQLNSTERRVVVTFTAWTTVAYQWTYM